MALNFPIGHVHQLRDCAAIFRRKIDERLLPSLEVISAPELTWPKSPAVARLCRKSRKLQGCDFFAKTQSGKQSLIRITSIALPKSPMSLT
jgi:hypothetical protein